jgi:hypothetical protein
MVVGVLLLVIPSLGLQHFQDNLTVRGRLLLSLDTPTEDSFGLRERLTVGFPRPTWKTIREIRAACARLPVNSGKPEDFLAALLFPILKNALAHPGGRVFQPSRMDGAQGLVDEKFDGHMSLQSEAFLKPGQHHESKKHGKLRTKFDRALLAMHMLACACKTYKAQKEAAGAAFDIQGWSSQTTCVCTFACMVDYVCLVS